ncbi:hypothetical protein MHU86_14910 [Fragilaria crotonensis]|nr:hypothetical protein MHU86_14910 [Fragilaria crotonensis]
MTRLVILVATLTASASAFTVVPRATSQFSTTSLSMIEPNLFIEQASSMMLAETEPWVQPLSLVLDPFLNLFSFAMLCRIVLSWYPTTSLQEMPWILVAWPTEFLLRSIRNVVPPAFGVDITPIVWLGVFTFVHEILLGQQGLLTMKIKYGI